MDPDSVANPYGRYGSPYSPDSINNPCGQYGSPYLPESPNNPYGNGMRIDDGRLKRLLAQLRYPQPYLASFGLQAALVVSGPGIPTCLAALIALRIAQPIRLGIQHG